MSSKFLAPIFLAALASQNLALADNAIECTHEQAEALAREQVAQCKSSQFECNIEYVKIGASRVVKIYGKKAVELSAAIKSQG